MSEWNPLLVAIALKKIDIVRYLLQTVKISLTSNGSAPGAVATTPDQEATNRVFCLKLAVVNKDLEMLKELWGNNFLAWEVPHL